MNENLKTFTGEPQEVIMVPSGWQLCPKCKGQGKLWFPPGIPFNETFTSEGSTFECDVCKGKKIISIDFGYPPL